MPTYGMPRFNLEHWRQRAFERNERYPRGRLQYELSTIDSISRVIDWCLKSKIDINFDGSMGGTNHNDKIIVNICLAPERQLHVLLHECGHWVLGRRKPDNKFKRGYDEKNPIHLRTLTHRIDVLHEELEAWHEGLRVANIANVNIDYDQYQRTRTEYVKGYLKWVLKAPGYEGGLEDANTK